MKSSIPATLLTHLQGDRLTTAWLVLIERTDGVMIGFTNYVKNITVSAAVFGTTEMFVFRADAGITPTDIEAISNFDNDNYAFDGVFTANGITRSDILTERCDNAAVKVYLVNYTDPDNQLALIRSGRMGTIKPTDLGFNAEVLGLSQFLQNSFGQTCSADCRADLGDERCKVNLNYFGEFGVVSGVSETETRRTFAADILSRQWVNTGDSSDALYDVNRWSNLSVSDPAIVMAAGNIVTAPHGTFANIQEGAPYVIAGFANSNNNREFYIKQKIVDSAGIDDDQLVLGGWDLDIPGHYEEVINGSFLIFADADGKLTCSDVGAFHFLYVGCEFEISGSDSNDGFFKVLTINVNENEITIDPSYTGTGKPGVFVDEAGTTGYDVTFIVWPRVEASTQRYYGYKGQFGGLVEDMKINVEGFSNAANNGTGLRVHNSAGTGVAEDGSYITMWGLSLVSEIRESTGVKFTIPHTIAEAPGTAVTVYPSPGPGYQILHRTEAGVAKWAVSGSNWFTNGMLAFVSGSNAGIKKEVRKYDVEPWYGLGNVPSFHLLFNMPYEIQAGDLFVVFAGCNKTAVDCSSKFGNIDNFRGEPFCPGEDGA